MAPTAHDPPAPLEPAPGSSALGAGAWATLLATVRACVRSPAPYLALGGVGVASAAGLGLGVLALTDDPAGDATLVGESAEAFGVILAVGVLCRWLDLDARSGFTLAADQTAAGEASRVLGRWGGSAAVGVLVALVGGWAAGALLGTHPSDMWLLVATSWGVAQAAAWALALHAISGSGIAGLLGALAAWGLGHLPWTSADWVAGGFAEGGPAREALRWGGRLLAALLPHAPATPDAAPAATAALLGLLALALSVRAPRHTAA